MFQLEDVKKCFSNQRFVAKFSNLRNWELRFIFREDSSPCISMQAFLYKRCTIFQNSPRQVNNMMQWVLLIGNHFKMIRCLFCNLNENWPEIDFPCATGNAIIFLFIAALSHLSQTVIWANNFQICYKGMKHFHFHIFSNFDCSLVGFTCFDKGKVYVAALSKCQITMAARITIVRHCADRPTGSCIRIHMNIARQERFYFL